MRTTTARPQGDRGRAPRRGLPGFAILVAVFMLGVSPEASAETNAPGLKAIVSQVLDEASTCDIGRLDLLSLGTAPALSKNWSGLWFTGLQTEGCEGGNNYGYSVSVHDLDGASARVAPTEPLGFPWVESVEAIDVKGTLAIRLLAPDYAADDARCCPSLMREVRIWAEGSRIAWKTIRTWQPKK